MKGQRTFRFYSHDFSLTKFAPSQSILILIDFDSIYAFGVEIYFPNGADGYFCKLVSESDRARGVPFKDSRDLAEIQSPSGGDGRPQYWGGGKKIHSFPIHSFMVLG